MTGNLQQKNGKYYIVLNTKDCFGKRKQEWIRTGLDVKGNKRKAQEMLNDILKESGNPVQYQSETNFADYLLQWLYNARIKLDDSTYNNYLSVAQAHIIPYFKKKRLTLEHLTKQDIQSYVNYLFEKGKKDGSGGLSAVTIKKHMAIIKQAIREAVKDEIIDKDVTQFVNLPKKQKFEPSFYSANQINDLLNKIKNEELYPLIYFTVALGLRRSEVLGLKWDSISFELNTITIKHTVVISGKDYLEKDRTKNDSSYRTYPMFEDMVKILNDLKAKQKENEKLFKSQYIKNDYIFKWPDGKLYTPDYVSNKFKKLLVKYNLPIIRFHDLRHSCASLLVSNGFTIKDIQDWLGHADIQTTANIYAHLDTERKKNIMLSMTSSLITTD